MISRESRYERVASLISRVRNAKFGEIVKYLEELIDSGIWRDFTTPVGVHFTFLSCEFDYFLISQQIDPVLVRYAYLKADDIPELSTKQMRLADITGRGREATVEERRRRSDVAKLYDGDPSGAGARMREPAPEPVVTERLARVARDANRRTAFVAGQLPTWERPNSKQWRVRWSDDRAVSQAVVDQLLREPELAHEVYKKLNAARESARWRDKKRRSEGN